MRSEALFSEEFEEFGGPWPSESEGESSREKSSRQQRWIQQSLNAIAGSGLKVTGTSDAATRAAIAAFQKQQGLKATGKPDYGFLNALVNAGAPLQTGVEERSVDGNKRPQERCTGATWPECPVVTDRICATLVAGVPFDYVAHPGAIRSDRKSGLHVVARREPFRSQCFVPQVKQALERFLALMTQYGMPVERILTAGSHYCRCISHTNLLSNHSFAEAIDVVGLTFKRTAPGQRRETLVHDFRNPAERRVLLRVGAVLRLAFPQVIDFHYNSDHFDHFHCDLGRDWNGRPAAGFSAKSATTLPFLRGGLEAVLGRNLKVTASPRGKSTPYSGGVLGANLKQAIVDYVEPGASYDERKHLKPAFDKLREELALGAFAPVAASAPTPTRGNAAPAEQHEGNEHASGAVLALMQGPASDGVESFDTYEHALLGTPGMQGIQALVDAWAKNGLVEGGAFIDTGAVAAFIPDHLAKLPAKAISEWKIHVPRAMSAGSSGSPYAGQNVPAVARWHWIAPDPVYRRPGERWTAMSLRAALASGEALALNLGQILFLAGDLVPSFAALKGANAYGLGVAPSGTMLGYSTHDPYAWEAMSQLSPNSHLEGVIPHEGLQRLNALEEPKKAENKGKYEQKRAELTGSSAPAWAVALRRHVEFLRKLRGPSGYSELHLLAQTLWLPSTLGMSEIIRQAPWLAPAERTRPCRLPSNAPSAFATADAAVHGPCERTTYDDQFFQEVVTNGRYLSLAFNNGEHFSPRNWDTFEGELRTALAAVQRHVLSRQSPHPIPADAIAQLTYGLHFLTDAFSAGHMRTPRDKVGRSGGITAKAMHDLDGRLGLNVKNGFGKRWRAFGDGRLSGPTDLLGSVILGKLRSSVASGVNASADANLKAARAAVGSAMKQLHYYAQSQRTVAGAAHVRPALDANRGNRSDRLAGEEWAPDGQPGFGPDVPAWIGMSLEQRLKFLRLHQPQPFSPGTNWTSAPENHPPLLNADGSINQDKLAKATYSVTLGKQRYVKVTAPTPLGLKSTPWGVIPERTVDALDASKLYYLVVNQPRGATWMPAETKLLELFRVARKA